MRINPFSESYLATLPDSSALGHTISAAINSVVTTQETDPAVEIVRNVHQHENDTGAFLPSCTSVSRLLYTIESFVEVDEPSPPLSPARNVHQHENVAGAFLPSCASVSRLLYTIESFVEVDEPSPPLSPCSNCKHHHGQFYGGILFCCAMHPTGPVDSTCPDQEVTIEIGEGGERGG
jgi:hypothetical protein